MFFIFLSFFISSIYFFSLGSLASKFLFNENLSAKDNYYEYALIGMIFASIIPFFLNFFFSLNKYLNDLIFILPIILVLLYKINLKISFKKIILCSFFAAIISTITMSYDNVYRPDAGLYHLPFISLINDQKIIIGLSNLHFRFGHTSIFQYLSGSFNNHIFGDNGILIPHGLVFSFIILYLIKFIFKEQNNIKFFIAFLFLIFIFFRMNRYSSFGNDAPSHFYFLFLIILSLDWKKHIDEYYNFFNKISLVAVFIFFNKITMLFSLLIPVYFLINKKFLTIYKNKFFLIICFIFFSWILKNILISGCIIFPVEQSCIKNLSWFDKSETRRSNAKSGRIENEAWTKGAPNQTTKSFEEYIETYEWIVVWKKHHGKKILEKVTPFLVFTFFLFLYILIFGRRKNLDYKALIKQEKIFIYFLIILNLLGSIMWFLKFPVFRYGYGYLISFFSLAFSSLIFKFFNPDLELLKKGTKYIILIFFIGLLAKNSIRISDNLNEKYSAWPSIYSDTKNNERFDNIPFSLNNEILLYAPKQSMCYYSKLNPCSHLINFEFYPKQLNFKKVNGYKKYSFIK